MPLSRILYFVFLSSLFMFGPILAENCRDQIRREELRPPDEIDLFLKEFRAESSVIPPQTWRPVLEQLMYVNFKDLDIPKIRVRPHKTPWKTVEFKIDRMLIEGWWRLGLIKMDGRFNFQASREEVARNFRETTGYQTTFEPTLVNGEVPKTPLESHRVYLSDFLNGKVHLTELHDFIFHAPWFLSPERREWFSLAARFDLLTGRSGEHSVLNALFEYGAHSRLKTLRGTSQLIYSPGLDLSSDIIFPDDPLISTNFNILNFDMESLRRMDLIATVWRLGVQEDESITWFIAFKVMDMELARQYLLGSIPSERRDEAQALHSDLASMIIKMGS